MIEGTTSNSAKCNNAVNGKNQTEFCDLSLCKINDDFHNLRKRLQKYWGLIYIQPTPEDFFFDLPRRLQSATFLSQAIQNLYKKYSWKLIADILLCESLFTDTITQGALII